MIGVRHDRPITVVISQPMLLPWVGMFEQIRHADVYVHYDDVQFSKGSFANRVQLKGRKGSRWLTIPLRKFTLGTAIADVQASRDEDWRTQHRRQWLASYSGAPYLQAATRLLEETYATPSDRLVDITIPAIERLANALGVAEGTEFVRASELGIPGRGTQRVEDIVRAVGGTRYVTGHGASRYFDHERVERGGIEVRYIAYRKQAYPQLHGAFTPYVTALDLVANVGPAAPTYVDSPTVPWRTFVGSQRPASAPPPLQPARNDQVSRP